MSTALFQESGNGLHFKYSDIGASAYKSLPLLARAVETLANPTPSSLLGLYGELIKQDAWHIQNGSAGMTWTATGNDTLQGGADNDLLIGGLGDDILDGGMGYDRYLIQGRDSVRDADGLGRLEDSQGRIISGVILKHSDGSYSYLNDPSVSVVKDANLTLTWSNGTRLVIENFQSGQLGLTVQSEAAANAVPSGSLNGDQAPQLDDVIYLEADNDHLNWEDPTPEYRKAAYFNFYSHALSQNPIRM